MYAGKRWSHLRRFVAGWTTRTTDSGAVDKAEGIAAARRFVLAWWGRRTATARRPYELVRKKKAAPKAGTYCGRREGHTQRAAFCQQQADACHHQTDSYGILIPAGPCIILPGSIWPPLRIVGREWRRAA